MFIHSSLTDQQPLIRPVYLGPTESDAGKGSLVCRDNTALLLVCYIFCLSG